jgi:hypothetical protein
MITDEILKVSQNTGKDVVVTFNDFLDYCIDCFTPPKPVPDSIDKSSVFFNAFVSLQLEYLQGIDKHGWCDPLGDVFMDLTKGMRSYRGQFFTPPTVCDMMCGVIGNDFAGKEKTDCGAFGKRVICNDSACGSARNLIAFASKFTGKPRKELPYFIGEDIDAIDAYTFEDDGYEKDCLGKEIINTETGKRQKHRIGTQISDSKKYQLAGNSIVVNCMYHIFDNLFVHPSFSDAVKDGVKIDNNGQLSLF